jgi:RecB family exonuclease
VSEPKVVRFAPGELHRPPFLQHGLAAAKRLGPHGFLYLCGTERLQRSVEEDFAARSGGAALSGSVVTLDGLGRLFPSPRPSAEPEEVALRLWAALAPPSERGPPPTRLSFVEQVWELLATVRREADPQAGADEEELDRYLTPVEQVSAALEAAGQEDPSLQAFSLAERVRAAEPTLGCVVVDGFESYPRALAAVVEALAERSEETWVLVEGAAPLFPGWEEREPPEAAGAPVARAVPPEALDLFLQRALPPAGPIDAPDVHLLAVKGGEREEVEVLARHIRDRLREFPRATVVVAFASLPSFAPRVLDTFPRFGLSPQVRLPGSLLSSAAALPLRRLVEVVARGCPRAGVLELLEDLEIQGHLARFFASDLSSEEIDRHVREAKVRQGRENFPRDLRGLAARWSAGGREAESSRVEAMADGFDRLFAFLAPVEAARTPVAFIEALRDTLEGTGLSAPGSADDPQGPVSKLLRAAHVVEQSLGPRIGQWSLSQLQGFVETTLALYPGRGTEGEPGIAVTGLHDAGLLDVDYVFLGGLSEAHLPADRPSPLLSPGARARIGLASAPELALHERDRIARVLARARKGVFLSYSAGGDEGEVLPSLLLNDLLLSMRPRSGEALLSSQLGGRVYSTSDAMTAVGRAIGSDRADAPSTLALLSREGTTERAAAWHALLRGLRVEQERRRSPRATGYDGPGGGPGARELARRRYGEGRFGVRQLQEYLRCPYRFYLENILALGPAEDAEEEVDAPALGSEVHRLFFELHQSLRGADGTLRALSGPAFLAKEPEVRAGLEGFLADLRPRTPELDVLTRRWLGPPGRPGEGALAALFARMAEDLTLVRPAYLELAFDDRAPHDTSAVDPHRLPPLSLGEVSGVPARLVGRIDRLSSGASRATGLVVDDYKTGRSRPHDQLRATQEVPTGLELQLPLYMAASLAGLRAANPRLFPLAMRYVWLSSREESGFIPLLKVPERARDEEAQQARGLALVDLAVRHAQNAVGGILEGRFPVNGRFRGRDGGCAFASWCPHALGCRFDAGRFAREGPA